MENKKIKNIALLLLSVLPIKVLAHYFIYTSSDKQFKIVQIDHSFAYHIYNIFNEEVWLFIPVILFVLFIGWYFGLFDLKRNSKSSFSGSKVVSKPAPPSKEETKKRRKYAYGLINEPLLNWSIMKQQEQNYNFWNMFAGPLAICLILGNMSLGTPSPETEFIEFQFSAAGTGFAFFLISYYPAKILGIIFNYIFYKKIFWPYSFFYLLAPVVFYFVSINLIN